MAFRANAAKKERTVHEKGIVSVNRKISRGSGDSESFKGNSRLCKKAGEHLMENFM